MAADLNDGYIIGFIGFIGLVGFLMKHYKVFKIIVFRLYFCCSKMYLLFEIKKTNASQKSALNTPQTLVLDLYPKNL